MSKRPYSFWLVLNLLVFVAVLALAWLGVQERARLLATRADLQQARQMTLAQSQDQSLLTELAPNFVELEKSFVGDKDVPVLIENLERLAGSSKVAVELTQAEVVPVGASDERLRLGLAARGSFSALTNYLSLIEALPYEILFPKLSLEREASGQVAPVWRLELTLEIWGYRHD